MSFKIFDGSNWNTPKKLNLFDGGSWKSAKKALSWNGSSWVEFYSGQSNINAPEFTWSAGTFGNGAGQTVSVSNGTWAIEPDSYKYQWSKGYNSRVPDNQENGMPYDPPREKTITNWSEINGATSNSYALTKDEVGYFIKCSVIAVTGGTDSDPAYAAIDSSPLPPQRIANSMAFVQQDSSGYVNGKIRFFWDVSEGADGYYVTYQGPGIPAFTETIIGKTNNLYDKDFGSPDETFLFDKTSLGISVQPFNNTSPALSWWRWATANNKFDFTGTGSSQSILDLLPKKASVTATLTAPTPYVNSQAIQLSWTNTNIIQTKAEVYLQIFNDETMQTEWSHYAAYDVTTATSTYIQTGPGVETGPWAIKVYGSSRGFAGPWDGVAGLITSANIPPENGTVFLTPSGAVYAGDTIYASSSGWDYFPTSDTVKIIGKAGSVPQSITDGVELRSGPSTQSYTVDASDVEQGIRYRAFATATNSGGTSGIVASIDTATATVNPPISVTIPNFVGSQNAYGGTNYTIYYAAGTGTSNSSLSGTIASQSPSAGTYLVQQANLPLVVSVSSYVYQEPAVVYKTVPNYVGSTTADGTYGDWTLTTNQNTGTSNASLAGQIVSQSPIAGTQYDTRYVSFPTGVSINRYQYQAPGYDIYVYCVGTSGDYGGVYGVAPAPSSNRSYITGTTSNPNLTSAQIVSLLGIPNACYVPPFGFTPFGFTPFGFTPFGFTPFGFTPFGFTPFGFTPVKSIGADTLVASKVPEGLTLAHNLSVGDVLYSADIEGLDLTSGQTLADYFSNWSAKNPVINTNYETTIVSLSARIVDKVIIINGNKYSYSHYILIKRDGVSKFVKVYDVLDTDMVYSPMFDDWQPVIDLKAIEGNELVISINTEPYDVFFTDNAIVHDSHEFNAQTPGAISSSDQSLGSALEQLYQEWKLSQGE